ncbi:MAG: membrane protein insertase YidC [Clostridia bacterium]
MAPMIFNTILSAEMTNWIGKLLLLLSDAIGNFGVTVIVFSILLKVLMSPLDVWQRVSMNKQQKSMAIMQPKLEKLQKQYANRPDVLKQKQMELQKDSHINVLASCLPMVVSMVVFFVVFAGFRALIVYENQVILENLNNIYTANFGKVTADELNALLANAYQPQSFLWIKNIFMSDIGVNVIPDLKGFTSNGFGGVGAIVPEGLNATYQDLVGPAMAKYNKQSFWDAARWNGYFVLPLFAIGTSFLSTKIMQKSQPQTQTGTKEQQQKQQSTMKYMNYLMPLMLGFFAIMYSAAFAIYYVMSNVLSTLMSVMLNVIIKKVDANKEKKLLADPTRR